MILVRFITTTNLRRLSLLSIMLSFAIFHALMVGGGIYILFYIRCLFDKWFLNFKFTLAFVGIVTLIIDG